MSMCYKFRIMLDILLKRGEQYLAHSKFYMKDMKSWSRPIWNDSVWVTKTHCFINVRLL